MGGENEHDFHVRRARAELDLAYRTGSYSAMISHLRLSALHMDRARKTLSPVRPSAGIAALA
jgi:hypothetical protein